MAAFRHACGTDHERPATTTVRPAPVSRTDLQCTPSPRHDRATKSRFRRFCWDATRSHLAGATSTGTVSPRLRSKALAACSSRPAKTRSVRSISHATIRRNVSTPKPHTALQPAIFQPAMPRLTRLLYGLIGMRLKRERQKWGHTGRRGLSDRGVRRPSQPICRRRPTHAPAMWRCTATTKGQSPGPWRQARRGTPYRAV